MKLTPANILINLQKSNFKAVLLYGPDSGMISLLEKQISDFFKLERAVYEFSELTIESIHSILKTNNLFFPKQLVKISNAPTSLPPDLKAILLSPLANFVIFTADELSKTSSIRKFFETEKEFAIAPCYVQESSSLGTIIKSKISPKRISEDAIIYLSEALVGDSYFLENEIAKLLIYAEGKDHIDLEDVVSITSSEIHTSPDKLCSSFASGDIKTYSHELSKLFEENISPVWIVRALIRYYLNMYLARKKMIEGASTEAAISSLSPPIMFKYLPDFRKNLSKNNLERIQDTLSFLHQAEVDCKTTGIDSEHKCKMLPFVMV